MCGYDRNDDDIEVRWDCERALVMRQVDPSVSFDQVGGLDHYIKALKEMVFLPLVYPELFERFHISPPRGVLFYGPPGAASHPSMFLRCFVSASFR